MKLLLNAATAASIRQIIKQKPQGVLVLGNEGAGKSSVAHYIADAFLGANFKKSHGIYKIEPDDKGVISIDEVRKIRGILKLKVPSNNDKVSRRRIIVIRDAHMMQDAAQNSLLKTLEEPPADTSIILTATSKNRLLPTVVSRLTAITVLPLRFEETELSDNEITTAQRKQAFHLSGGNAGLFMALARNEASHPLLEAMTRAKNILTSPTYERMLYVDELVKEPNQINAVLYCMKRILEYKLHQNSGQKQAKQLKKCLEVESSLHGSANKKLLLTDLFLEV